MVGLPIEFKILKFGENHHFDNFFRNAFIHFYLRTPEVRELDRATKLEIAKQRREAIERTAKFLVAFDIEDPNVFYSFVAFNSTESKLYVHFAYVKKNVRGFGFFQASLEYLKENTSEFYYTLPIKLKKKHYLPDFERRVW